MKTKEQITKSLQENREYLHTEFGVEKIGIFGSYAKGTPGTGSDIDLVIEFSRPIGFRFVALAEHLEELLDVPVDLLTPEGVSGIRVPQLAADARDLSTEKLRRTGLGAYFIIKGTLRIIDLPFWYDFRHAQNSYCAYPGGGLGHLVGSLTEGALSQPASQDAVCHGC